MLERYSVCGISVGIVNIGSIWRWPSDLYTSVEFDLVSIILDLTNIIFLPRLGLPKLCLNFFVVAKIYH